MKTKVPNLKQVKAVRCPICGAGPGEKCELTIGQSRTKPHRDRRLIAEDRMLRLVNTRTRTHPGASIAKHVAGRETARVQRRATESFQIP